MTPRLCTSSGHSTATTAKSIEQTHIILRNDGRKQACLLGNSPRLGKPLVTVVAAAVPVRRATPVQTVEALRNEYSG
jgi:hypothetical protein